MAEEPKPGDVKPRAADAGGPNHAKGDDRTVALDEAAPPQERDSTPPGGTDDQTVALDSGASPPGEQHDAAGAPDATHALEEAKPGGRRESAADPHVAPPAAERATGGTPYSADDELTVVEGSADQGAVDAPTVATPARHGRPRLILESDGDRMFPLTKPEMTLGRSASCDIVLSAPTVSRLHAKINLQGGECLLTPVGSQRNTYVNDELITRPIILHDGDRIQISREQLRYKVEEDQRRFLWRAALGVGAAAVVIAAVFAARHGLTRQAPIQEPPPAATAAAPPAASSDTAQGAEAAGAAAPTGAPDVAVDEAAAQRQRAEEQMRDERIRKLLYEGDVAFLERRYTTPVEGSAVYAYSEVLKLDPDNERALTQVGAIIDMYLDWAERAQTDGRSARARLYRDKAAYIHAQVPAAGDAARVDARLEALHSE